MKIDKITIDEIIRRTNIVELVGEYINLKQTGKNHKGLCPFHNERTPSFSVSVDGFYHCFGCGESGNAIKFLQKYLNLSFVEAVKYLGNRCGVSIHSQEIENTRETELRTIYQLAQEYYSKLLFQPVGASAYEYFSQRHILPETMRQFSLGYSPDKFDSLYTDLRRRGFSEELLLESKIILNKNSKYYDFFRNRAMFPIKDFLGRAIAFGGRQLIENKSTGKYINSSESLIYDKKSVLFGLFEAKNEARKTNEIFIVEGYLDVISLWQTGIKNVVAPCGTALTFEQLQYLKKHTNSQILYFLFDGDSAGRNATLKSIPSALEIGFDLRIIDLPDGQDPDTIINQEGGKLEFENYKKHYLSFIDFISVKLNNENLLKTPVEKSKAIKTMLKFIWKIKDKAQHNFYIDNIKEIFNYPASTLMELYYAANPDFNTPAEDKNKINIHNNFFQEDNRNSSATKNIKNPIPEESSFVMESLVPEEKIIFKFAIQSSGNFNLLIKNYNISENIFITDTAKTVCEFMNEHWDSNNLLQDLIQDERVPEHILNIISSLKLEDSGESANWKKFTDGYATTNNNMTINITTTTNNFNDNQNTIEITLAKLRIKNIDKELENLKPLLKMGDESLLKQWQKLLSEKQELLDNKLKYE